MCSSNEDQEQLCDYTGGPLIIGEIIPPLVSQICAERFWKLFLDAQPTVSFFRSPNNSVNHFIPVPVIDLLALISKFTFCTLCENGFKISISLPADMIFSFIESALERHCREKEFASGSCSLGCHRQGFSRTHY